MGSSPINGQRFEMRKNLPLDVLEMKQPHIATHSKILGDLQPLEPLEPTIYSHSGGFFAFFRSVELIILVVGMENNEMYT